MSKWIRWWGLGVFLVIVLLWWLFIDSIVKLAIESAGSEAVGAKVELAAADLQLSPLGLTLHSLAVTNPELPMENLLQAQQIELSLDSAALLGRKIIITDMTATGLAFNTARKSSGALSTRKKTKQQKDDGAGFGASLPGLDLPDPDTIIAERRDEIDREIESIQSNLSALENKWKKKQDELPDKNKLDAYQQRWDELKDANMLQRVAGIKKLRDDIKDDLDLIESLDDDLKQDMKTVKSELKRAQKLPGEQADKLLNDVGLGEGGFIRSLFGKEIGTWVNRGTALLQQISSDSESTAEPPKPPRGEGRWIEFAAADPIPDFLLQNGKLQGALPIAGQTIEFDGTLANLTHQPKRWKLPATLAMKGSSAEGASFTLNGLSDHRGTQASDSLDYQLQQLPLLDLALSGNEQLSLLLQSGLLNSLGKLQLNDGQLQLTTDTQLQQLAIETQSSESGKMVELVSQALQSVDGFDLQVNGSGSIAEPDISISSSLDQMLQKSLSSQLGEQTAELKQQLSSRINSEYGDQLTAIGEQGEFFDQIKQQLKAQKKQLDVIE